MPIQQFIRGSAWTLLYVCRRSGVILIAYAISTLLVICWLLFTTNVTLQENREDAAGMATPGGTSEYIRVAINLSHVFYYSIMPQSTPFQMRCYCLWSLYKTCI